MDNKANNKLKEEIEKVKKERDEYKNRYLRALADYSNFENRVVSEKGELVKSANTHLILKLLPLLDHLEKAEIFVKDQGLKIVKDDFVKVLKDLGLEEIDTVGKPFDPHVAEAVDVVAGEKNDIVTEVLRKGYRFAGKVLRVAQVKVSKKIEKNINTKL